MLWLTAAGAIAGAVVGIVSRSWWMDAGRYDIIEIDTPFKDLVGTQMYTSNAGGDIVEPSDWIDPLEEAFRELEDRVAAECEYDALHSGDPEKAARVRAKYDEAVFVESNGTIIRIPSSFRFLNYC